jgi:hypothetical protein
MQTKNLELAFSTKELWRINKESILKRKELLKLFRYNTKTGKLYYRRKHLNHIDIRKPIGWLQSEGYLVFQLNKRVYSVARFVYFLHHGTWPKYVDHKNGIRTDNRISNLRSVTKSLNARNRHIHRNGHSFGTHYYKARKKWIAQIPNTSEPLRQSIFLGYYSTENDAKAAVTAFQRIITRLYATVI